MPDDPTDEQSQDAVLSALGKAMLHRANAINGADAGYHMRLCREWADKAVALIKGEQAWPSTRTTV